MYAPVAFVLTALGYATPALFGGSVVVGGAMIPDLDQRIPGVKHCGPTHTVWCALAVGVAIEAFHTRGELNSMAVAAKVAEFVVAVGGSSCTQTPSPNPLRPRTSPEPHSRVSSVPHKAYSANCF